MNNKKIIALILAFAMMFSSITVAFADTTATIGADAAALKTMGVLQGDDGGVTPAYLAKETTRMQAAIMFLRLKGLEDEAKAFTGTANFADANTMAWAEGKAMMAYLKANPQLGWVGTETGKFNPLETISAQQYYKVMLEALGYKQTTPEVVGDFSWADVITFAASKGLVKAAAVAKFTNNDVAIATVEALKTNVKETTTTLVAAMVEAGMINRDAAVAAGLIEDATTTAAIKAVKAIGNNKVEVEFDAAVTKAFAEKAANYTIVEKGTTTALEVKAAVLDGTTKVVVETAAQTAGKAYTMTVGSKAINFGGIAKDTAAAELDSVKGTDTQRVELTFTKVLDLSALDKANYSIEGATIVKASWADSSRKVIELTTEGLVANKTYKVTATNIKTVDLVNLKSAAKNFVAKSDKTAPTVSIDKASSTNTRVIVYFNEEVTKESAENLANYSLTVGSTATELEITAAKLVEDKNDLNGNNDDEDMAVVELTTASQKTGTKYVLHVNNIVDASVLANKMAKEAKIDYYGIKVDETKPTVSSVDYLTNKIIRVVFNETSRLDAATVLDINNYTVNNDIVVEKVEFEDANDADNKAVRLTVSELGEKSSYQITIKDVADEYGNVMTEKKFSKTFSEATINIPATIAKAEATSKTTVKVTFTKEVSSATAKDVANYTINNSIGAPVKVSLADDAKSVTLTVGEMTANKEYEVAVNGVTDLAGNVLANVKAKFVAVATENDVTAPEIEDIEVINNEVVRVTFSEEIDVDAVPTISINTDADATIEITGTYAVSADDDNMVLEFTLDTPFAAETDVKLASTTAKDIAGNVCADTDVEFASVTDAPELVELVSWEQTTVKQFKLIFSEKIDEALTGTDINDTAQTVVPYGLDVEVDEDDNTIVYLNASQVMDTDKTFELDLSILTNYHGTSIEQDDNDRTILETTMEDEDAPYIDSVAAINRNLVEITFSEDLSSVGTYTISYEDEDGDKNNVTINGAPYFKTDSKNVVRLNLTTNLDAKYVYTLEVATQAKDIAGNKVDDEATFDFAGTNVVAINNYVTGVKILNGSTFMVNTFANLAEATVASLVYGENDSAVTVSTDGNYNSDSDSVSKAFKVAIGTDTITIGATTYTVPTFALVQDVTYTVTIDGKTYEFEGIVDTDVDVTLNGANYDFNYSDMEEGDVVVMLESGNAAAGVEVNSDLEASIATAGRAANADILVIRDGVVLFFAANVELPTE